MIEQTELVVSKWKYSPPTDSIEVAGEKLTSSISLDIMRKRAATKKGIACRFSSQFYFDNKTILDYEGEDSYVIDLPDIIDKNEVLTMIRNSFSKFKEKFDFRKLSTVLSNKSLLPLDESKCGIDAVLEMLK